MVALSGSFLRPQQARWLKPEAHRWVRPDAARYLKPGADVAKVFPALGCKYNPSQPRVPAGNSDGGQWTSGNSGGSDAEGQPVASADFGDLTGLSELLELFRITLPESDLGDLTQLAGDFPSGDGPEFPTNEPPEILQERPSTSEGRMTFVRAAAQWIGRVGRFAPAAETFLGALDQLQELHDLTAAIKSANDPPRTLEELQDRVNLPDRGGYHRHHIVEESAGRRAGFSEELIQGRDNLVLVPVTKHIEISSYYATKRDQLDGSRVSPRDMLHRMNFEERRQFGLKVLRDKGVLK